MKVLKLLILGLLVFAGEKLLAQNAIVINNTVISGTADFNLSCGTVSVPIPGSNPLCGIAPSINQVDITLVDPTCSPVQTALVQIVPTFLPYAYTYTLCSGTNITFVIDFNGTDYILTIN